MANTNRAEAAYEGSDSFVWRDAGCVMMTLHRERHLPNGRHSLAETAAIVGYYDQPHMNLEFREWGGLAPGDFLATTRYSPTTMVG